MPKNTFRLCLLLTIRPEELQKSTDGAIAMKWLKAPWVPYIGTMLEAGHTHKVVGIWWPVDADYFTVVLEDFITENVSFFIKQYIADGWEVERGL